MWPLRNRNKDRSPYLEKGRLADVLAALQVMSAGRTPEATLESWANKLSPYDEIKISIERWEKVFNEHPEFFLVYPLTKIPRNNGSTPADNSGASTPEGNSIEHKAALRWRYVDKLYNPITNKSITVKEKEELSAEEQKNYTARPFDHNSIGVLVNTAISLHSRAIEDLRESRFWFQILGAGLAFLGAVCGGIGGAVITAYSKDEAPQPFISIEVPRSNP